MSHYSIMHGCWHCLGSRGACLCTEFLEVAQPSLGAVQSSGWTFERICTRRYACTRTPSS